MAKTYWEKLKDPRWQKRRLEIFNGAGFKCEACGDKDSTLHVHHGVYWKGRDPWDYPDNVLWCLCESCHEMAETTREEMYTEIACVHPDFQELLASAVTGFCSLTMDLMRGVDSYEEIERHANNQLAAWLAEIKAMRGQKDG